MSMMPIGKGMSGKEPFVNTSHMYTEKEVETLVLRAFVNQKAHPEWKFSDAKTWWNKNKKK